MSVESTRLQKIEGLVAQLHSASGPERDAALELVQTVLEFHAAGIDRMMEIAAGAGEAGWQVISGCGNDPLVAPMLLLHGLHPLDLETRVHDALEKVRPSLKVHGGNVELVGITDGAVRLRLIGNCNGCPSSAETFRNALETAIYEKAPDVTSIQCEGTSELVGIHNAA